MKLLADAIYNHNTGGVAWTNRDSDAVRRVIHNEFPHIDLENDLDHDTIVNARRNYDLMYMYHIATGKYSKLKKETVSNVVLFFHWMCTKWSLPDITRHLLPFLLSSSCSEYS